jgi:hypothetical protein
MPAPIRFVLECKLCSYQRTVDARSRIKPDMTEERATALIAGDYFRAEERSFRTHWKRVHPAEVKEVMHHVSAVMKLAQVTSYHKQALSGRVGGPSELGDGGSPSPCGKGDPF